MFISYSRVNYSLDSHFDAYKIQKATKIEEDEGFIPCLKKRIEELYIVRNCTLL